MPLFETVESILELRDTARHLWECISAHVVILSPCDRTTRTQTHWVFDESFDNLEMWNVPMLCWQAKNTQERYGAIPDKDIKPIWDWFNARRLMVAQVVFSYPDVPMLPH